MTKDPAEGEEGYTIGDGCLTIYTKTISDYAIGYNTVSSGGGGGGAAVAPTSYTATASTAENGTVSLSKNSVASGTKVTVTVTPKAGYRVAEVVAKDANGKVVAVTKNADGTYSYTQPASNVTVSASFVKDDVCPKDNTCPISKYSDADAKAWYHDGVHWALENSVMNGYSNGSFGPTDSTSRAMVVTMLWRMEGSPVVNHAMNYSDVGNNWFAEAVRWASANGIVTGGTDGKFAPNDAVTREQFAAILYRYAQFKGQNVSASFMLSDFDDATEISPYAVPAMRWACAKGIVSGVERKDSLLLLPRDATTRAVVATMLMRYITAK